MTLSPSFSISINFFNIIMSHFQENKKMLGVAFWGIKIVIVFLFLRESGIILPK
ncbi:hypothetical protein ACTMTD_00685 [Streptococcus suis]|uniref:hypothetical protein n=1 Tax=Streptococcus suis TaxID=1307 RepID=UPI003F8AAE21